ncbi:25386_t:CDS:2 [Dentiscutata erythropus]|uniref:25386_t:CDS:1 n=1 Tax=Dentiscutata erythropus TaxID=1348616 RepID=A0A9N9D9W7_9GLOM|nr:25386_t:CDS:2 [Dentiscutata erythropus]
MPDLGYENEYFLYLSTKIVTPGTFTHHQGYDIAIFDDRQYPLSDVPRFKVLKSELYGNFKVVIAKHFGFLAEQIKFWVLISRHNKTVRPTFLITDDFFAITMEEIHTKMAAREKELYLFLEVAERVAVHLSTDPFKLQFTTAHPTTGTHKTVVKRTTNQILSGILQTSIPVNPANILYYEVL